MAAEFLNFLSIGLSCAISGYFLASRKEDRRKAEELSGLTGVMNENLKNFHLAYQQFSEARLDIDNRLTSLEFNIKGVQDSRPKR